MIFFSFFRFFVKRRKKNKKWIIEQFSLLHHALIKEFLSLSIIGRKNEQTIEIMEGLEDKFFGVQLRDNQFGRLTSFECVLCVYEKAERSKQENNAAANLKFQPKPFLSFHNVFHVIFS